MDEIARKLGGKLAGSDWLLSARDSQLPPENLGQIWLMVGGRGAGKSWSLNNAVAAAVRAGIQRINYVVAVNRDALDVAIEGPSGFLSTYGSSERPVWRSVRKRLEFANGATVAFYSGEEQETLRGAQCEEQVFQQGMFGCRLGDKPRCLIATTPRPTALLKKLINDMPGVSVTRSSTYERHLSPDFLQFIQDNYAGTRIGRREISGELLADVPDALWRDEFIRRDVVPDATIDLYHGGHRSGVRRR